MNWTEDANVSGLVYHLTTIGVILGFIVLVVALWKLLQTRDASTSQRMMKWRVSLQFVAVVCIVAFALVRYA